MPKIIKRLKEYDVRNAYAKKKPYKLYDDGGLRLLIRPTGTKVWQYPYKYNGKTNTYTIGKYGIVGLADARSERDRIKHLLSQGINPNKHKQAQYVEKVQLNTTFESVAREWHGKGTWVTKHAKNILRSLQNDVFPIIGSKHVDEITSRDIIEVLVPIENRGALDVAKRIANRCECVLDYAIIMGLCDNNVASGRSKYLKSVKSQPRPHFKEDQLPDFFKALDGYHGKVYIKIALHLLALTFVRPGELRNARWEEFDLKDAVWRIPAERMKMKREHIVPLSKQALFILNELKQHTGNGDWLFPSVRSPHKSISDVTLLKAIKIMGYIDEKKITPHGFRHTASTILNENGFNPDHIEKQLAHKDKNKVRSVYNHAEYKDDRKIMMQWYADHLEELKNT